jgi:GWxTD domain-containing protein
MRGIYVVLFITFFAVISVDAQKEEPTEFAKAARTPKFFQDILDFSANKNNLTRMDVFISIPYASVQFVKSDKGFTNNYSVTVSVFDKDKVKLIEEKVWKEKLEVSEFDETTSKDNNSVSLKSFFLQPGEYFIRSSVHDNESNTDFLLEHTYKVRDLSIVPAISDVMLLAKNVEEKGIKKITPNVSGDVMIQREGLPLFFEVYSSTRGKVNINYIISDSKYKKIFEESEDKDLDSGRTQVFYNIKDSSIALGVYHLEIVLKSLGNILATSTSRIFTSRWAGVPMQITDLDKAVEEMIYIASPHDIDTIEQAPTKEEKLKRFLGYWKKISPTPDNDDNAIFNEYYRRVNYANEHFSKYFEGWRSDQGMVFILLGTPDIVNRHPFDVDSKPYEVWEYYNLNQSLMFVDRTGFGDYRLVTPLTGDLYRFRM